MQFNLSFLEKFKKRTAHIGIEVTPSAICVSQVELCRSSRPKLHYSQSFYGSDFKERQYNFTDFIRKSVHKNATCNMVLHPAYYRLLLVDAPEVEAEELQEAMRWRIKELISEPIDKVMIDVITLPKDAYEGRMNMVYVAVAPLMTLEPFIQMILQAGLKLESVDIAELAVRNVVMQQVQEASTAILCIKDQGGFVTIMTDTNLYLTRSINVNVETLHEIANDSQEHAEQLIMEVQRSLDYYESQLGKAAVGQLLYVPAASRGMEKSMAFLEKHISCPIERMDIMELFNSELDLSLPEQAHCLSSIGAALRNA